MIKKENYRHTSRKRLVGSFVILLAGILLVIFILPKLIFSLVGLFWMPIDGLRIWLSQSGDSLPAYFRDRNELLNEIKDLKTKIASEQGTEHSINRLEKENNRLRELLGTVSEERILARVIARPNDLPYDLLMLDIGREQGLIEGAPVYVGKDQVIGLLTKVEAKTSLVTLVTTPGVTVSAYIYGPNIFTIAEGIGGGVMRVRVPQGIILNNEDLVILPALDSGVLGKIGEVVTTPTNPERHGYITFDTPIQSLRYVSVGTAPVVTNTFDESLVVVEKILNEKLMVDVPPNRLVRPDIATSSETISTSTPVLE